jgi:plasmid stabilization system protein ParE
VKRAYVVSKGAAADLREITRYTVAHWGAAQCRSYVAELERASEAVARGEGAFRDLSAVFPGLRMIVSGKHFIFCMPRANAPALILAILHERMDVMERLKNRLR